MRRAVSAALVAAVALGLTAGCSGSGGGSDSGGANDPFYGVISAEPLPDGAKLTKLGDGGAGTLRVNLAWAYVQSSAGARYDWSHYDPVVANAARNGIRVLATVYGSPVWAEPTPEYPPLGRQARPFEAFVRAAVRRYGADGSFWSAHPDLPKLPIRDWQFWNEPNFALFWKPSPDPAQYLRLLRGFHSTVKDVDPAAQVVLGGVFPTPADGIPLDRFLTALYRGGARHEFDAMAIHPYAATPRTAMGRVAEARHLMDSFGDRAKPIWITEVGWASGGAPSGLTVGPARQASYLSQTYRLAAANRDRLGIAGVVWYSLSDTGGAPWPAHCGLFTVDGAAKPAWSAYAAVAGGSA